MKRPPKLSVIIPAFNAQDFISDAIQSLLEQSFRNLEILIVDDGSTDETLNRVIRFQNDSRVRIIAHTSNRGLPAARNSGIRAARGKFIGFLDADDIWFPEKAEIQLRTLEENGQVDFTFSWYLVLDEQGDTGRRVACPKRFPNVEDLVMKNWISPSSVIARRECFQKIGGFDESLKSVEDLDLWLRLTLDGPGKVLCVPKVLTAYRIRTGQMSANVPLMAREWNRVLNRVKQKVPHRISSIETRAQSSQMRYYAYLAYETGDHGVAWQYLLQSLRINPWRFLRDPKSLLTTLAILSTCLPVSIQKSIDKYARQLRARVFGRNSLNSS